MCADGRSCEFFLMCWMSAGLLDGSCGGIMFACCQRKDPKALTDYNLIESPRDQSRPLPLDLYTETASDDRKSFLRKRMPSVHTAHTRAHTAGMTSSPEFSSHSLSVSLSLPFISHWSVVSPHRRLHHNPRALACASSMYHRFPSVPRFSIPRKCTLSSPDTFHSSSWAFSLLL